VTVFYDFSGGMESAAMLALERDRIAAKNAIVRWADTGKHFPEMYDSIRQIEGILGLLIVTVPRRIDFDTYLFERGGMVKKGTTDCSRKMKRSNLMRHAKTFPKPYEVNLGFNSAEDERAEAFTARNERDWCHWRYPLIELNVSRADTVSVCERMGFTVLVGMYEKMGRFDCFWCGNQKPSQALKVAEHYPELAAEWVAAEERKGHSFMRIPLKQLVKDRVEEDKRSLFSCSCFGGEEDVWAEDES
jgi:hypothetical protein